MTTNQTAYRNAAFGVWIPITSTEYAALKTNLTTTTTIGVTNTMLTNATFGNFNNLSPAFVANVKSSNQVAIPANTYIVAAAFNWRGSSSKSDIQLYADTNSSSPTSGYEKVGGYFPSTSGTGIQYYVRKGVSAVHSTNEGLLGIYTGVSAIDGQPSGYWIGYLNTGGDGIRFEITGTEPTSSTTLTGSLVPPDNYYIGLQGITTTSVQWVTS